MKKPYLTSFLITLIIGALLLGGCDPEENISSNTSDSTLTQNNTTQVSDTQMTQNLPRLEGKAIVEMIINGSPVRIEVNGEDAPITAGNFVDLVERGFYNGLGFHRVVKERGQPPFVAQGGDPLGNGTGGFTDPNTKQPRYIPLEIKPEGADQPIEGKTFEEARIMAKPVLNHRRGAIAMARSQAPNSASSQFYFALSDLSFLDGNYAVFGYVVEGMDVVDGIKQGDKIQSAKVVQKP
jgi:peptidyl-prolyl cis-trans isomerase B (cyclophilin B)